MKLYAPKYYKRFACIADKCTHSCCIGWEIDIDKNTLSKYSSLTSVYGDVILNSIEKGDSVHFSLVEGDRCPHLDECGLCKIIKEVGESFLCDICREHPRFYNFTNKGKEVGIGISCEEACRLVLTSDDYDEIIEIGDAPGELDLCEYDATLSRQTVYKILKNHSLSLSDKMDLICNIFGISVQDISLNDIMSSLEYLHVDHKKIFTDISRYYWRMDIDKELERIFGYFVYRHCSEECSDFDFRASLLFAMLCTLLISSVSNTENIYDMARIVSEEIEYSEKNTEIIKSLY